MSDVILSKPDLSVELKQWCALIVEARVPCKVDLDETCVSSGETMTVRIGKGGGSHFAVYTNGVSSFQLWTTAATGLYAGRAVVSSPCLWLPRPLTESIWK